MIENISPEIGWMNAIWLDAGWLTLTIEEIPVERRAAGKVHGNGYHQELADVAANWLASLGLSWRVEQWHAGYCCDLIAGSVIVEVGNTDPDRAIEHLHCGAERFCVVPYQDGEPMTMLVFQRGPAWDSTTVTKLLTKPDQTSKRMADRLGL